MTNPMFGRFRISWDYLDPQEDDLVLSVGCGEAELELKLVEYVKFIDAIDKDSDTLDKVWDEEYFVRINLEYGDVTQGIPSLSNHYDKVLFLEVLEHLSVDATWRVLREIHRVLKPGGRLVLSVPNNTVLTKLCDPAWWLIGHRHYPMWVLTFMMKNAGFRILDKYTGGGYVELVWIPIFYVLLRLRLAKYVKPAMDRLIDREYRKPGFYTNIVVGQKGKE